MVLRVAALLGCNLAALIRQAWLAFRQAWVNSGKRKAALLRRLFKG